MKTLTVSLIFNSGTILQTFGQRVRTLRQRKGLTQETLADGAGLDRSYIGGVERGERNVPLANIQKIAKVLGVSVSGPLRGIDRHR